MQDRARLREFEGAQAKRKRTPSPSLTDYPVREYVAAMASELAGMARWDGDEKLADALDFAAGLARGEAPGT